MVKHKQVERLPDSNVGRNNPSTSMQRSSELRHAKQKHRGNENKGIDTLLARREELEDRRRRAFVPSITNNPMYVQNKQDKELLEARALRLAGKTEKYKPTKPKEVETIVQESLEEKAQRLINEWGLE